MSATDKYFDSELSFFIVTKLTNIRGRRQRYKKNVDIAKS